MHYMDWHKLNDKGNFDLLPQWSDEDMLLVIREKYKGEELLRYSVGYYTEEGKWYDNRGYDYKEHREKVIAWKRLPLFNP